jgi:undecaprenyl-diphosphatase
MVRFQLSPRLTRLAFWIGGAALAFAVFLRITDALLDPTSHQPLDEAMLTSVAGLRVGWLNAVAVDVTALGSHTLVVLHSVLAFAILLLLRDRRAALQLAAASVGAGLLTLFTKGFIERSRPQVVPRLVDVSGFSYPSGHSLSAAAMYLTIGFLVARHMTSMRARVLVISLVGFVIGLVAMSRVYLGVHYPSDIASGVSLGAAWAFLLAGAFSLVERQQHPEAVQQ